MDEEETHHLLQQVPSKHLSLLQRQRGGGGGKVFGTGEVQVCVCGCV